MFTSLKNQSAFNIVNKLGKKYYKDHFLVVIAKNFEVKQNSAKTTLAIGIKVTKKLGKAHVRNKIKRRIRHIMRVIVTKNNLNLVNTGIIVVPKLGFDKIKFALLYKEFEQILI